MAQTIKLKRSATTGNTPTTSQLALGELGINTTDGKLFLKKSVSGTESIVEVGGLPLSGGTLTGNLSLGDNVKATFGASDDLQIFHDGSHSYISDVGTGDLILQAGNDLILRQPDGSTEYLRANEGAGVQIYHNGSQKFLTTATGIDVTGSIVASGDLQLGNDSIASSINAVGDVFVVNVDSNNNTGGTPNIQFKTSGNEKLRVNPTGIDVTGSVVADGLTVDGASAFNSNTTFSDGSEARFGASNNMGLFYSSGTSHIRVNSGIFKLRADDMRFTAQNGTTDKMTLSSSNNVNIPNGSLMVGATTAPSSKLTVITGTSGNTASFLNNTTTSGDYSGITLNAFNISGAEWYGSEIRSILTGSSPNFLNPRLSFFTQDNNTYLPADRTEKMSILGNGSVGIGTSSPTRQLSIYGTNDGYMSFNGGRAGNHEYVVGTDSSGFIIYDETLDAYRLVIDQDSGSVGIGTSSPQAPLHVAGNILCDAFNNGGAGSGLFFRKDFLVTSQPSITLKDHNGSSADGLSINAFDGISFSLNDSEKMRIDTLGRVGIGCSPSQDLHIREDSGDCNLLIDSANGASQIFFGDDESANIGIIRYDHGSNFMRFVVNGSNRMKIDSSGRVGIGTDSPSAKLDVAGTVNAYGNGSVALQWGDTSALGSLSFDGSANPVIRSASSKPLVFQTNGANERMRIESSGNVGIGTSSPSAKVHLGTTGSEEIGFGLSNSQRYYGIQTTGGALTIKDVSAGGTERMRIDSSGRVGIGTASTTNAHLVISSTDSNKISIDGGSSQNGMRWESVGGANTFYLFNGTFGTAGFGLYNVNTAKAPLWVTNAGNVGIGTSSPSYALDVSGAAGDVARFTGDANNSMRAYLGSGYQIFQCVNSGTTNQFGYGGGNFYVQTAGTERMRIDSSGNVGIGDSSPSVKLDVYQNTAGIGVVDFRHVNGNRILINPSYNYHDAYNHIFRGLNGTDTHMTIDNSGNVGIGTSSPDTKLHLVDSTPEISLTRTSDFYYGRLSADGFSAFSNANGNAPIIFKTATNERTRIASNGTLYHGKTADSLNTGGLQTLISGQTSITQSYTEPLRLNRMSTDGAIVSFYKDGTTVGSIQSRAGLVSTIVLDPRSGQGAGLTGAGAGGDTLRHITPTNESGVEVNGKVSLGNSSNGFRDLYLSGGVNVGDEKTVGHGAISLKYDLVYMTAGVISPSNSDGTDNDNAIDLGKSAARFDDIYATNGTIQTSDRNEKQDIEDLTEAEERVAIAAKGLLKKFRWKDAVAEKGDDARIHFGIIAQDLQAAFEAEGLDAGRYGMFTSNTWTNEDGEEQTRMGVRYSELLAFIISAI